MHKLLNNYRYRNEWFYDVPEVHTIWNNYISNNRFKESKIISTLSINESIASKVRAKIGDKALLSGENIKDIIWEAINGKTKYIYLTIKDIRKYGYVYKGKMVKGKKMYELRYVDN